MASRQSLSGSVKGTGLNNDATDHGGRERLPPFLFKYIVLLCRKTIVRRRTSIEKKPKTNEEVYSKPVKFVKEGDAPPAEATCFRKKKPWRDGEGIPESGARGLREAFRMSVLRRARVLEARLCPTRAKYLGSSSGASSWMRQRRQSRAVRERYGSGTGAIGESYESGRRVCLLYTSPSPRDKRQSRMPSSA